MKKREIVQSKKEILWEISLKYLALHNLLTRNQRLVADKKINIFNNNVDVRKGRKENSSDSDFSGAQQIITFPFVVLDISLHNVVIEKCIF